MNQKISSNINGKKRILISTILLVSSFICLMSQTMMVTALPIIQRDMNQPTEIVQWLTTGYMLLIGIITPISSFLYNRFSSRQFFIGSILLFLFGTLIGSIAFNFWTLLLARLIQALSSGILSVFQMATLVSIFPPEKRGTIMGISSLVVAFGPAIGPTLSGVILSFLGWRYLFIIILPIMLIILIIGILTFPNFTQAQKIKVDIQSIALSIVGPALILISLSLIAQYLLPSMIGLVLGTLLTIKFIKRQLKLTNPILKVKVFNDRGFRLMTIISVLVMMNLLGMEQMLSIFVQDITHLSSAQAGLVLFPGAILNALCAAFSGQLYDRVGIKIPFICGVILLTVGTIPFLFIRGTTTVIVMTISYAIRMIGISLIFSPSLSESFLKIIPQDISHATAIGNTLRQVFGSISVSLLVTVSSLAPSFLKGMQVAMWITMIFIISMVVIFIKYLCVNK